MKSRNPLKVIVLTPIVVWSRWISPSLPPRCKYEPSCSRYAIQAIEELGILRGTVLAVWRVLRCNPWSYGGVDKVADQSLFKVRTNSHSCQHEVITQR